MLSLADATVAIVTTQRVILTFELGAEVVNRLTPLLGIAVSIALIGMGSYLIVKASMLQGQR